MPDNIDRPKAIRRRRCNTFENWEVAIIKTTIKRGGIFTSDQDILAYFTRPTRSVNHRLERFAFNLKHGPSHNALKSLISGSDI